MIIEDIAYKINELSRRDKNAFSKIQEIRKKHGSSPRTWSPFAAFSIKSDYAFHAGGRKEFQFNIGNDELEEETIFRYGLAFSLIQDRTLHNSEAEFRPIINRFNKFLKNNNDFLKGFNMWYYSQHAFVDFFVQVREIDDVMFKSDNFIFIGKYFKKSIREIDESDLLVIIETFNYLMPLYEEVQFGVEKIEKRIARLCWNDNGWIMPSGISGKSIDRKTHEGSQGYGHEEWLFDTGRLIDGYHYGFLEPIRKQQNAYEDRSFDVWLYTIDNNTKNRYWIGEIKNLEVINKAQSIAAKEEYIKRGWFEEMKNQLSTIGSNANGFSDWIDDYFFNVRYLPLNLKLNDPYCSIPRTNPIYEQSRYSFSHFQENLKLGLDDASDSLSFDIKKDDRSKGEDDGFVDTKFYTREPKMIEIIYLHDAISKALTKELKKIYGNDNVKRERFAGYGANRIDIVVKDIKNDLFYYEIKSYVSLRTCIREAIGQLMEYALWTNKQKAKKLIVITQPLADFEDARIYFKHLRDTYGLPLYYQSFDFENNILSEIV